MHIDLSQVQPIVRELELAAPVALVPLSGGSSEVFRVDLADGQSIILKTYPENLPSTPQKDAFAASLLADVDVPVTRYLMLDESRSRLPFRFALTSYLPGESARNFRGHAGSADLYRQAGALLRRLHAIELPAYGAFDADGITRPMRTNAEFLRPMIDHALGRFIYYGGDAVLEERLKAILETHFDAIVIQSRGPVFTHDDLHPGNILVTLSRDGTLALSGLVDFGNARAADATFDLAKCLFCAEHEDPASPGPMLEGYGPIDHPNPRGALWYYTLLHRVIMWWWLRHIGAIASADTPSGLIDDLRIMAENASPPST
jgi:aminoglycoside phosphotransferase (APT) family kinase protein